MKKLNWNTGTLGAKSIMGHSQFNSVEHAFLSATSSLLFLCTDFSLRTVTVIRSVLKGRVLSQKSPAIQGFYDKVIAFDTSAGVSVMGE